jgi:hypothetical protein
MQSLNEGEAKDLLLIIQHLNYSGPSEEMVVVGSVELRSRINGNLLGWVNRNPDGHYELPQLGSPEVQALPQVPEAEATGE